MDDCQKSVLFFIMKNFQNKIFTLEDLTEHEMFKLSFHALLIDEALDLLCENQIIELEEIGIEEVDMMVDPNKFGPHCHGYKIIKKIRLNKTFYAKFILGGFISDRR